MRNSLIAIFCFICVGKSFGQATTSIYGKIVVEITKEKKPKKIYAKVEIKSAFIGGDSSWVQSIEKSINQSIKFKNGAKPGKYYVSVQFVVAKDSSLTDVRCLNDPGFGMGAEVVRAVKKGRTPWTPAHADGVKVREYRQ
jgi:protein TonB